MGIAINEELEKYRKYIKTTLNKKRYIHSLGVSYTAAALAMRYQYDINKAQIAGLLHDCAKNIPHDELIKKCIKADIPVTKTEMDSPELLHSKYGSYLARKDLNIQDDDILNAIYYHTTGRPNMSLLEQIIFISDYIEPNRANLPQLDAIRKLAFIDIEQAISSICIGSIKYLEAKQAKIDSLTIDTFNYYKQ